MFKQAICHLLCAAFAAVAFADEPPGLKDASVTIPYAELRALWQAAQREAAPAAKPKPPVEAALLSARYELSLKGDQATGFAEYEAESFVDGWTVVPLLGPPAQIDAVEPATAQIVLRDDRYALVMNRPGRQKIKVHFAAKLVATNSGWKLRLPVAPALVNTLSISGLPPKQNLMIAGATELSAEKERASFRLAAQEQIDLELTPQKIYVPPTPSRWKVEPQALVEVGEGALNYETRLIAQADNGSGLSMELEFPAAARVLNISGTDLADWQMTTYANHAHVAHLRWQTRDVLRREIEISYSLPQAFTAAEWQLAAPGIIEGESAPPLYLIVPKEGLELTAADPAAVPRTVPRWLSAKLDGKSFVGVVGDGPLAAKWLPLVETPRAVVESAQAAMRIVADGAVLNEMTFAIRHDAAMSWPIDLPEGSELLACSIDGHAVNPIKRGEHVIEIPLPAGKANTQVKISCTARKPAFKPVSGQIVLELPATDLLVHRIDWELRIPGAYEVAALEGNVEALASNTTDNGSRVIKLRKELCKGERPRAELFYEKPETATK